MSTDYDEFKAFWFGLPALTPHTASIWTQEMNIAIRDGLERKARLLIARLARYSMLPASELAEGLDGDIRLVRSTFELAESIRIYGKNPEEIWENLYYQIRDGYGQWPGWGADTLPFTVREAANRLRLTPRRVRQLCQSGLIASTRMTDGSISIDAGSLEVYEWSHQ